MLAAETTRGRRFVCSLDRGAELVSSLRELVQTREVRSAEVRGGGFLDEIELVRFDPAARRWLESDRIGGPLELLWLWGNVSEHSGEVSLRLQATALSPARSVVGGHLASARVYSLELVIECFDDVILRRHPDPATGLPQWKEAISLGGPASFPDTLTETIDQPGPARALPMEKPAESTEAPSRRYQRYPTGSPMAAFEEPTPTGQISAASPSERASSEGEAADPGDPAAVIPGDLISHPRLGRCVVEAVEVGGEYAKLRLRSGRIVRLSLTAVELKHRPGTTAPRIFDAHI